MNVKENKTIKINLEKKEERMIKNEKNFIMLRSRNVY